MSTVTSPTTVDPCCFLKALISSPLCFNFSATTHLRSTFDIEREADHNGAATYREYSIILLKKFTL